MQYLTRQQSSQATEQNAGDILDNLKNDGYVEIVSGEKGESVQFTDKAIYEVFG